MATKKPLVISGGKVKEIAATDSIRDVGVLASLTTTDQSSLVAAINEVVANHTASSLTVNQRILSIAGNYSQSIM